MEAGSTKFSGLKDLAENSEQYLSGSCIAPFLRDNSLFGETEITESAPISSRDEIIVRRRIARVQWVGEASVRVSSFCD